MTLNIFLSQTSERSLQSHGRYDATGFIRWVVLAMMVQPKHICKNGGMSLYDNQKIMNHIMTSDEAAPYSISYCMFCFFKPMNTWINEHIEQQGGNLKAV